MFSRRLLIVAVIAVFSPAAQAPADWTATESLPDTYYIHSMAHAQGYLYHVGGFSSTNGVLDGDKVFYAQVTGPGTIAPWVAGPALPAFSSEHALVAWGDKVYVVWVQKSAEAEGVMRQELEDGVTFISAAHRMRARFGPQTTRRQQNEALHTVRFAVALNIGPIRRLDHYHAKLAHWKRH